MQGVARPNVERQDRWPFDRDVTHHGVARRLSVLLSLPVGRRITRDIIHNHQQHGDQIDDFMRRYHPAWWGHLTPFLSQNFQR